MVEVFNERLKYMDIRLIARTVQWQEATLRRFF